MNKKEQILELIIAQDIIRRIWAEQENGNHLDDSLREIDKDITKTMNIIGGCIEVEKAKGNKYRVYFDDDETIHSDLEFLEAVLIED